MSLFQFCLEIINKESSRFNVGIDGKNASQITAATASDISFDIAHNRCAYLYRCGAITLSFGMDCFKRFLSDHKSLVSLLSKWIRCPDLTVCSLSKGPALDYIALFLSYQTECNKFPFLFKNIKVISKYGAWRNTVNIMLEIINSGSFQSISPTAPVGNIEVIQGDPLENLTDKIKLPISEADIILMMKTLNLQADGYDQDKISKSLQEFLATLKPGAVIFCIDTKPSISLITRELASLGHFLYEPTHISTLINVDFIDLYKNIFGCTPVLSARGSFFVWEKSTVSTSNVDCLMDEVSESVKHLLSTKNISDCYDIPLINRHNSKQHTTDEVLFTTSNYGENDSKLPKKALKPEETNIFEELMSKNISSEKLNYGLLSNSFQNIFPNCYSMEKENDLFKDSASVDEAIQTELEDLSQGNNSKVVELTNRIAQLTRTLSDMLDTTESDGCTNDRCLRSSGMECKHSVSCHHDHCHPLPLHGCHHRNHFDSRSECCLATKCCQFNPYPGYSIPNHCNSNASLSACENFKHSSLCESMNRFPQENDSNAGPKLVIPLNNLSEEAVCKILSIVSQPNQE